MAPCPITENGVVRNMSGRGYPNGPWPVAEVVDAVESLRELGRHRFIGDTISITDSNHIAPADPNVTSKRLTDSYRVALSGSNDATFVTLDLRLVTAGVVSKLARVLYLDPTVSPR